MKRQLKKVLALSIMATILLTSFSFGANAMSPSKLSSSDVLAKQDLVKYAQQNEALKTKKAHYSTEKVDKMIGDILSSNKSDSEKESMLEAIGVYQLKNNNSLLSSNSIIQPYSSSSSAVVSTPSIMFDSGNNGWVVGMNVTWTGRPDSNEGGEEAYGVYFYNTSGPLSSLAVQSVMVY